jgi:hypothetical protein
MDNFFDFPNVLNKKGLNEFLDNLSPLQKVELRCEQFLNLKIFDEIDELAKLSCQLVKNRKGQILQARDLRFSLFIKKPKSFPNINFFNKAIFKKKKKIKNFSKKIK